MDLTFDQAELFGNIDQQAPRRGKFRELFDAMMREPMIPASYVAGSLGCSKQRAYFLMSEGRIPTIDIAGSKWVPLQGLEFFMTEERKAGRKPRGLWKLHVK